MYSYIKGTFEDIEDNCIIVDNHGIGYRIEVPESVLLSMQKTKEEVKIYTYLNVKEDTFSLFGFLSKEDRKLFRLLLKINGVGPKAALAILSTLTADELRFAVLADDTKAIAKTPGIGAKTAQRIVLELKDKMELLETAFFEGEHLVEQAPPSIKGVKKEAVEALVALGYSSSEAASAVAKVELTEEITVEELLKQTLKHMAFM